MTYTDTNVPPATPDDGKDLLDLFVAHLKRRLNDKDNPVTAAEGTVILALLRDNSITLASIRKGDFGETAKRMAEEYPFPDNEGEG